MPLYNDVKKCQQCGKDLTIDETERIENKKTLRLCEKHWSEALILIEKILPLWNNLKQ